jgi:choline-glycine betaine transporter
MYLGSHIVPLGIFVMVVLIVAIGAMKKMREKELEAHHQLRLQEMEHERKMRELEIEKAKVELEKARTTKNG